MYESETVTLKIMMYVSEFKCLDTTTAEIKFLTKLEDCYWKYNVLKQLGLHYHSPIVCWPASYLRLFNICSVCREWSCFV